MTKPAFMRRPWRITPCPAVHGRAFLFFLGIILQSLSSFAIRLRGSACALPDARRLRHLRCDSTLQFMICITKISTFLILCDLAVCLATLYVSFSLVFALMRYLQGKVFLIRFYSPTTLSSSRAEFRLPSRLACA